MKKTIAVIGGGAGGMMAAVTAAREGAHVTIYERNDRLGKKILATGNGKCNLGNLKLSSSDYHSGNPELVAKSLNRFGVQETIRFFESIGLMIKDKNGYLYPVSEQASSVLDVLRLAVERSGIEVRYLSKVTALARTKSGFEVTWEQGGENGSGKNKAYYDAVILACGSKASPKTGSDGSGYKLAKQLEIPVTDVVPALVQLLCREEFFKGIAGVRTDAMIHIVANGSKIMEERGELQLTEHGISGIPVFQLSGRVNRLLKQRSKDVEIMAVVDFLPDVSDERWQEFASDRIRRASDTELTVEEFFTGMLNKKLMTLFVKLAGMKTNTPIREAEHKRLRAVFELCKNFTVQITGSQSYDNAQVCAGGVDMRKVSDTLEACDVKGLYFVGEVLDVDGRCGGYNLQWAWTSGYIAGKAAAIRSK